MWSTSKKKSKQHAHGWILNLEFIDHIENKQKFHSKTFEITRKRIKEPKRGIVFEHREIPQKIGDERLERVNKLDIKTTILIIFLIW